ncbi:MAG: nucleoside deaminase [Nitrospira sp.]|nr:nucleoside deaminase [Nitrospira sp.]
MRRAIELSRQGMRAGEGGPFGAVIVKGGVIVGEGWNRVLVTNDPTAHAEMEAIRAAARSLGSFTLKGCELYTSAQPCPMCLGAIYWSRLDRVFYGNSAKDTGAIGFDDEVFYRQLTCSPQQRDIPEVQVLADEAQRVFREYEAMPGTIRY